MRVVVIFYVFLKMFRLVFAFAVLRVAGGLCVCVSGPGVWCNAHSSTLERKMWELKCGVKVHITNYSVLITFDINTECFRPTKQRRMGRGWCWCPKRR
jgi:hypothetical protein